MASIKDNTHTNPSTSWQNEDDVRAGSGPFGSPDDRLASHRSTSHQGFDDEVSALQRPLRPRRRDLMAGSRPRPIVPKSLSEAYRIAQAVCAAKMAPKGLDTPEACMIAIMHGLEVGLSPLSALQRIAVINGRPTLWGDGALALVKASGLCEAIEEWIEGDDPQTWIAVCNLMRKHDPVPVERRFSTEDAKRARLWGKSGPWSDYPKRMLQMRARAFALRDAFPDVLGGLYLTEEFLGAGVGEAGVERVEQNQLQPSNSFTRSSFNNTLTGEAFYERGIGPQNVSVESTQDWSGKATSRDEYTGSVGEQPNRQTATTLVGLDGTPNAPLEETGNASARKARSDEGERPIKAALPPLANLRRSRSMPRDVRALRFRNQWSVKQPRGPRKELSQTNAVSLDKRQASSPESQPRSWSSAGMASSSDGVTSRRTSSLETQRQSDPELSLAPPTTTPGQGFIPPDDITAHLDLYDAALCCATDPETLAEIAEEFTNRFSQLPRSSRNNAELIFEKHQARISADLIHENYHD